MNQHIVAIVLCRERLSASISVVKNQSQKKREKKIPLFTRRSLRTLTIIAQEFILSFRFTAEIYGVYSSLSCWRYLFRRRRILRQFEAGASHVGVWGREWRLDLNCVEPTINYGRPSILRGRNAWERRLCLSDQAGVTSGADDSFIVWKWIELEVGKVRKQSRIDWQKRGGDR